METALFSFVRFAVRITIFLAATAFAAHKLSKTLGVVGPHVVTSRDIRISFFVDKAIALQMANRDAKVSKKYWTVEDEASILKKNTTPRMLEIMVNLEAENFSVAQVPKEEIEEKYKKALDVLKSQEGWKELEVDATELRSIITSKLRSKAFLKFKAEDTSSPISDDSAKDYYEKNRVKFGNLPFDQFKNSIKEYLRQEQNQEKLKDWFEVLKRKYKVRFLDGSEVNV